MTGAEYKTLREALGLSCSEAAAFHRVAGDRTIRHWESDARPVPDGAASELVQLDWQIEAMVAQTVAAHRQQAAERGGPEPVELYRYRDPTIYAASRPGREGLPIGAHAVLIDRTRRALETAGAMVAIVYADRPMA